jgi:hypothetical protein
MATPARKTSRRVGGRQGQQSKSPGELAFVLATTFMAGVPRCVRTAMIEVLRSHIVRTAHTGFCAARTRSETALA